jgi:RNA polymerase sigma-70 factor (ECF subfamily)
VCRIAANLAINHVRSPRSREEPLPEGHAEEPAGDPGPEAGVLEREGREVLQRALLALPAEQRAVFVLRVQEELSYREIAEALDLSPGTVMSRLSRAREKLREALAPYLGHGLRRAGGDP